MPSRRKSRLSGLPLAMIAVLAASCAGGEDVVSRVRGGLAAAGQPSPGASPQGSTNVSGSLGTGTTSSPRPSSPKPASPKPASPEPSATPSSDTPPAPVKSLEIAVDPGSPGLTLDAGTGAPIIYVGAGTPNKVQFKAAVEFESGADATPSVQTWRSDKPTSALVDSAGLVTAGVLAEGIASTSVVITAEYGGKSATASVVVFRRGTLLPTIE